ncbi:hypothetical protein D3C71_1696560 [compost metagenome]
MAVVGLQQRLAVEGDGGEGIQAFERQLGVRARQGRRIHIESCAVLPVGQADPLQPGFRRTHVRIGNLPLRQQIGMHRAGHLCGTPLGQLRVGRKLGIAGQEAE